MIKVFCPAPLERLHSLGIDNLAIRANQQAGRAISIFLKSSCSTIRIPVGKLKSSTNLLIHATELSFSGWVGFFGYEFLARHSGVNLKAQRDLNIAEGWFGRPSTILHIQDDQISIESTYQKESPRLRS